MRRHRMGERLARHIRLYLLFVVRLSLSVSFYSPYLLKQKVDCCSLYSNGKSDEMGISRRKDASRTIVEGHENIIGGHHMERGG